MPSNTTVYAGTYNSRSKDILFVGDLNLGNEGYSVFTKYFQNATKVIWARGTEKTYARSKIRSKKWLITISFYNDFVFSRDDFDFLGLPLNIHPALPSIRGVGHDHVPLLESHEEHGSTLHYMNRPLNDMVICDKEIDSGSIIRVKKRNLCSTTTYADIRRANQQIALELLEELCKQMVKCSTVEQVHHELQRNSIENGLNWSPRYISSHYLKSRLEEIKSSNPNHRVFAQ